LLPIETNADSEAARSRLLQEREAERAALRREADVAGRDAGRAERRVQSRSRRRDPEAVGADQSSSVSSHEREQPLLSLGPLRADLGEPGRDHAQRSQAPSQRALGRLDHALRGQRDHREVDRIRDGGDRRVGAHARDRLRVRVDRVGGAGEVAGDDVPEQLAADRAAPRRRPDHRDAGRREEGGERGRDREVIAPVDLVQVSRGRVESQAHLGHAALPLACQLEARLLEHAEHRPVAAQHLGDEDFDADLGRLARELLQQAGAHALALQLVRNRERHLRATGIAQADVAPERHDPLTGPVRDGAGERAALQPVRIEHGLDERRSDVRTPVEAKVAALIGKPLEERDQPLLVRARGRAVASSCRPGARCRARRSRHAERAVHRSNASQADPREPAGNYGSKRRALRHSLRP
jgi:hypothetical protein